MYMHISPDLHEKKDQQLNVNACRTDLHACTYSAADRCMQYNTHACVDERYFLHVERMMIVYNIHACICIIYIIL